MIIIQKRKNSVYCILYIKDAYLALNLHSSYESSPNIILNIANLSAQNFGLKYNNKYTVI